MPTPMTSPALPAFAILALFLLTGHACAAGKVIQVGPGKPVATLSEASGLVADGDILEVAAGEYRGDVAVWKRNNLTIRAVGGRAVLTAAGRSAEGKAIWVIRGDNITVEGFDFFGAKVADRNGAGIRFEKGKLLIRDCIFRDNENGILTGGDPQSELLIENSEFGNNGAGDGYSHNLYVGAIARLTVTGSYFHHARVGHLLKSRAAENFIQYNRLTDEVGGRASYELDLPNGGLAYVIGNLIEQGSQTENSTIVAFGAEGYKWPRNELYLINNTLVDDRPKPGKFLAVKPGDVRVTAINNLLVGGASLDLTEGAVAKANFTVDWDEFVRANRQDYRLVAKSKLHGKATDPGIANGVPLRPVKEYRHPLSLKALSAGKLSPGALQSVE